MIRREMKIRSMDKRTSVYLIVILELNYVFRLSGFYGCVDKMRTKDGNEATVFCVSVNEARMRVSTS
jgi:hypothetical protein